MKKNSVREGPRILFHSGHFLGAYNWHTFSLSPHNYLFASSTHAGITHRPVYDLARFVQRIDSHKLRRAQYKLRKNYNTPTNSRRNQGIFVPIRTLLLVARIIASFANTTRARLHAANKVETYAPNFVIPVFELHWYIILFEREEPNFCFQILWS